jgi:rhodanese-related sulfurtransferase
MNNKLATLFLTVTLIAISACTTMESSAERPRYTVVDTAEAKALYDRKALFIDVRNAVSFEDGHVPGAVNMAWGRRFSRARFEKLADRDREIVIYCYGIHCELSSKATDVAVTWGYTGVHYFVKGFPAWWGAGYPIEQ